MKKIILASASPRRKKLLKQLGLEFEIIASDIEEKLNPRFKPLHQVEMLSLQKAQAVAAGLKDKESLIVAGDTMVAVEDEIIGKPKNEKDAKRILKKLSGRMHTVVTGFTIIDTATRKIITKSVETKVWFRKLNKEEINNYIKKEKPMDKSGAYAIHEIAAIFVEKIEGDYFGVVGLPLFSLAKELKKFGVQVL